MECSTCLLLIHVNTTSNDKYIFFFQNLLLEKLEFFLGDSKYFSKNNPDKHLNTPNRIHLI